MCYRLTTAFEDRIKDLTQNNHGGCVMALLLNPRSITYASWTQPAVFIILKMSAALILL